MAIQLNERDHMIFKLIEEHQVLLEKHISWFISDDAKPVLIRDRLRKLFYLDYLLCERHQDTLPWWTTPTKPLVYRLAPMTRDLIGLGEETLDLSEATIQRHLLEIANVRMLFLVCEKENQIQNLIWESGGADDSGADAKASFAVGNTNWRIGLVNHPECDKDILLSKLKAGFATQTMEMIFIVSRDMAHQNALQTMIASDSSISANISKRIAFGTHQELYKSGVIKAPWQNTDGRTMSLFAQTSESLN